MRIKTIKPAGRADVFNITVEGTHNYLSAGGVVLKNCDAIRGFCVYRSRANKELRRATDAELRAERDYVSFNKNDMFNVYQEKQNADSSDSFIGGQWGF